LAFRLKEAVFFCWGVRVAQEVVRPPAVASTQKAKNMVMLFLTVTEILIFR
jgi:hypothetical protein